MAVEQAAKKLIFLYKGVNRTGTTVHGEVEATTIESAKIALIRNGVNVKSLKKKSTFFVSKQKITTAELAISLRQLATMLTAGISIVQALSIIALGNSNKELQRILLEVKASIEGGSQLSQALAKHPQLFDQLAISLIAAGEQSGTLDKLMDKLAVYREKSEELKKKIKKATSYPIAVITIAVGVSALLLIKVVPQFTEVFAGFGAELPAFTQLVVNASDYLIANWLFIAIGIASVIFTLKYLKRTSEAYNLWIDKAVLHLPVIKSITRGSAIARFARTLATMFAAGVPLVDALASVGPASGNRIYHQAIINISKDISQGEQMNVAIKKYRHLFDEFVIQLIQIGEESGALEDMLNKVADFYESEVDNTVDTLSSLMEPVIIVFLGTVVGGLVVAMYLPIFKLGSVVG